MVGVPVPTALGKYRHVSVHHHNKQRNCVSIPLLLLF